MNISIKLIIGSKQLSTGKCRVYLQIIKNRKRKLISLGMSCNKEDFENESFTKNQPNYKADNEVLLKERVKANNIIRNFRNDDYNYTLDEFVKKFKGIEKNKNSNIITFINEIIDEMTDAGRIGNAKSYKGAKSTLVRYKGKGKNISFKDVDVSFLEKLESHMRSVGNNNGGIKVKMRAIRAIFNKAIERNIINQDNYPFKYYKISKLKSTPKKRALKIDEFKRIRDLDLTEHASLVEAHNYFLFSFYSRGINFADMMMLKWSDIIDGRIHYTRAKTKKQFSVEIVDKAQDILDYYNAQNRDTNYVFPILLKDNLTPQQIDNRKHKVISRYNSKLKKVGELAEVKSKLTSYVARHSFATILKQIGTSTDIISEMMGHTDVQITMSYLKEFDNEILDKENRRLLEL